MEVKTVNPVKIFYHTETTTLKEIMSVADREIGNMYAEAQKLGLQESGPMQFVYYGCDEKPDTKFKLEIAMVVDQEKPYDGKYKFKELEGFTCATTVHNGDISKIGETYEKLIPELFKSGRQITDHSREVYHKWVSPESPENVTEIQIGVN
jgi:effector-binding domain-containing protein